MKKKPSSKFQRRSSRRLRSRLRLLSRCPRFRSRCPRSLSRSRLFLCSRSRSLRSRNSPRSARRSRDLDLDLDRARGGLRCSLSSRRSLSRERTALIAFSSRRQSRFSRLATGSCLSTWRTAGNLAASFESIDIWIGTGMRGKRVSYQSSLVSSWRTMTPIVMG